MRELYFITLCLAILTSCSSPERVAEKALNDIGSGLFAEGRVGISSEKLFMFTNHSDIYSQCLIISDDVEDFLENGVIAGSIDSDSYFMTEVLFDNYELVSKKEYLSDLYSYSNYQEENENIDKMMREYKRGLKNSYKEIDNYFIFKDENVPCCELRYKLDNKYIATIIVIKIPDVGYRVCAVWID